jgi:hypothetical protein
MYGAATGLLALERKFLGEHLGIIGSDLFGMFKLLQERR